MCSSDLILLTSLIVQIIGLAPGTTQAAVTPEVVRNLAIAYLLVASVLAVTAAYWLARFPISRADHEARIAARISGERAVAAGTLPHK